ncbi:MAG: hypothetical protein IPM18_13655 [Phycisphaerales bacterium]|nr:hypothetical protein [Phycisphaerales bacterium]
MMRRMRWTALFGLLLGLAGCDGLTITLPDGFGDGTFTPTPTPRSVRVVVINDTNLIVDPGIRYDAERRGFFSFLQPARTLTTGDLEPGDSIEFNFACDRLGIIFSDRAAQYFFGDEEPAAIARTTLVLVRSEDFDCGDTLVFQFLGDGLAFGVVVSVNNLVVD